jgi:anti-sigma B factor antagonist
MGSHIERQSSDGSAPSHERADRVEGKGHGVVLSISAHRRGTRARIEIDGELDLSGAETLKEQARTVLTDDTTSLELDLGKVRFIDSTGLTALLAIHADAVSADTAFRVIAASEHFLRVVKLAGIDDLFAPID